MRRWYDIIFPDSTSLRLPDPTCLNHFLQRINLLTHAFSRAFPTCRPFISSFCLLDLISSLLKWHGREKLIGMALLRLFVLRKLNGMPFRVHWLQTLSSLIALRVIIASSPDRSLLGLIKRDHLWCWLAIYKHIDFVIEANPGREHITGIHLSSLALQHNFGRMLGDRLFQHSRVVKSPAGRMSLQNLHASLGQC